MNLVPCFLRPALSGYSVRLKEVQCFETQQLCPVLQVVILDENPFLQMRYPFLKKVNVVGSSPIYKYGAHSNIINLGIKSVHL